MANFAVTPVDTTFTVQVGENTLAAANSATAAAASADDAAQSAAYAGGFETPEYASQSAGNAATTAGQIFRVPLGTTPQTFNWYRRLSSGSELVDPLATSGALAAPDGAGFVGADPDVTGGEPGTVLIKSDEARTFTDFVPFALKSAILDGTSTADLTTYMQNMVDALATDKGLSIVSPRGRINIDGQLTIPQAAHDFSLAATGYTEIRQQATNTPIFFIDGGASYNSRIWGQFRFVWGDGSTSVAVTDTDANAIVFGGDNNNGYHNVDWQIGGGIRMLNGMHLVACDPDSSASTVGLWHLTMQHCFGESLMRGSMFNMRGFFGGLPTFVFSNIYQRASNAVHPMFDMERCDTALLQVIERNLAGENVANTPKLINAVSCANLQMHGMRVENEHYKGTINNEGLISLSNCDGRISGFRCTSPREFDLADRMFLFRATSTGRPFPMSIEHVRVDNSNPSPPFTDGILTMFEATGGAVINVGNGIRVYDYTDEVETDTRAPDIRAKVRYDQTEVIRAKVTGVTGDISFAAVTTFDGQFAEIVLPYDCTLIGVRAYSDANLAGGNLQLFPRKNGASIASGAFSTTITAGTASAELNADLINQPGAGAGHTFTAGDKIGMLINTSATLTSNTTVQIELLLVRT